MDARLTPTQTQIQESVRDLLEDAGGIDPAREYMDGDAGVLEECWSDLADLGIPALSVPEAHGGLGENAVTMVAVMEELGRYAVPGPYPETIAFAAPLIADLGTDAQRERYLPAIADGSLTVSVAIYDDGSEPLPDAIDAVVDRDGETPTLTASKTLVPYADQVDLVIVADRAAGASGADGISLYLVDPGAADEVTRLDSLDRTRRLYEVDFDGLELDEDARLGSRDDAGPALLDAADRYGLAAAAMLVGGADRAVELTSDYAADRTQYGQPIGKFQAVKHRAVDMWVDAQSARSLCYYAAWAVADDAPEVDWAPDAVQTFVGDRLHRVFRDDIWNHGGMGFTWDHDAHIYLKQAEAWRNFLGTPEQHADRLVETRLEGLD